MAIDTSSVGTQVFTDAELLLLTRNAIAAILVGGKAVGINGRSLTRADLTDLWATVAILESRINPATDGGTVVLGAFGGAR